MIKLFNEKNHISLTILRASGTWYDLVRIIARCPRIFGRNIIDHYVLLYSNKIIKWNKISDPANVVYQLPEFMWTFLYKFIQRIRFN